MFKQIIIPDITIYAISIVLPDGASIVSEVCPIVRDVRLDGRTLDIGGHALEKRGSGPASASARVTHCRELANTLRSRNEEYRIAPHVTRTFQLRFCSVHLTNDIAEDVGYCGAEEISSACVNALNSVGGHCFYTNAAFQAQFRSGSDDPVIKLGTSFLRTRQIPSEYHIHPFDLFMNFCREAVYLSIPEEKYRTQAKDQFSGAGCCDGRIWRLANPGLV
ncbi:hypothetical protein B0H14DRAFT_2608618 [Mycena olivaceomarginata]|nr:hypothetical protein B0H14DRAFT_2608618 [Mycena olivaceomarginata]